MEAALKDSVPNLLAMSSRRVVIAGGGAAGFLAAITCAETAPDAEVTLFEKSANFLSKVRISGGGRCNVTHACFDQRTMTTLYPRGERALIAPFQRFDARDTIQWFAARGVTLKTEEDGRMFPVTDSSQTIIDCLMQAARQARVKLVCNRGVEAVRPLTPAGFSLRLTDGGTVECHQLLLATGGCRSIGGAQLAASLGHTIEPPVPSLFTFHVETAWLRALAGVSVSCVEASVRTTKLRERGPLLITHWGLSGPAILRLSAWGARALHERNYTFPLHLDWVPDLDQDALAAALARRGTQQPAALVVNTPLPGLPGRLWEQLVLAAGIARETRWAAMSRTARHALTQQLTRTEFPVTGKSLNKDEFVTCGGVRLSEVNFKTMESRVCPRVFFAGELLDIDGITGGFNFQAAWTTGWIAGKAMAGNAGEQGSSATPDSFFYRRDAGH